MSYKEKERFKEQQDKFQAILSALLKDDDNKYCVDCDAKGPRWASWNLGIFLCIRCAGIHRNLGVHISRVKSVNLDSWTPEQVAMIQEIGNSRARAAYEANLPDGYRRPQTDSALEAFIRAKYEHKKYMAREWVPPQPKVPKEWLEEKTDKKKSKPKSSSAVQISNILKNSQSAATDVSRTNQQVPRSHQQPQKVELTKPNVPASSANDLLGLEPPAAASSTSGGNDLLELFGGPQPSANQTATQLPQQQQQQQQQQPAAPQQQNNNLMNGSTVEANLFGEDSGAGNGDKKASTKDSIMALFGGATSQPQVYGVPGGMYLPQGQQMYPGMMAQQPQGMMGQQPQGMMGQQPQGMMGQQPQGMMGQQPQGMMGQQPQGMMGQQPQGMMGQQPQGMMGQQPQNMMGQQPQGMMGQQPQGMMGQQPQNMMGQQPQGMMGQQPQGMMGQQQQGMMGQQPQGMMGQQPQGMMGQQPGMMGNPAMNGSQAGMYGVGGQGQMLGGNTGVYPPSHQMQQMQFQQMQQQMSSLKLAGGQMNPMPQQISQVPAGGGWGVAATPGVAGQTLSTNLWQ